jgi:hypothetical protein
MNDNFLKLDLNTLGNVLSLSDQNPESLENFEKQLQVAVRFLLQNSTEHQLMHAFYRLDLPEENLYTILRLASLTEKTDKISKLIINRLRKKAQTRRQGE